MPSNKTVNYVDLDVNSADAYWNDIVVPDVRDFTRDRTKRTVIHVAGSVWQVLEWVWHQGNPGVDNSDSAFATFRNGHTKACPQLSWLRDIIDAGKHRGIRRIPEVAGVKPHVVHVASIPLMLATTPIQHFTLVMSDGSHEDFDGVLNIAVTHWLTALSNPNLLSPFGSSGDPE